MLENMSHIQYYVQIIEFMELLITSYWFTLDITENIHHLLLMSLKAPHVNSPWQWFLIQ